MVRLFGGIGLAQLGLWAVLLVMLVGRSFDTAAILETILLGVIFGWLDRRMGQLEYEMKTARQHAERLEEAIRALTKDSL